MKYKNLIEYFLHWADVPPDNELTNKNKFNEVIDNKKFGKEYREILKLARKEYLEYTGKKSDNNIR